MIERLLNLVIAKPDIFAEHFGAYHDLMARDISIWRQQWLTHVLRTTAIAACVFLTLIFAGIAVMLWATTGTWSWA